MLTRLSIQNYAIINELEVDFSSHLNILTGETGAGKSIIIGALGLILGRRADANSLKNREKKCIIEGVFKNELLDEHVTRFLSEEELDVQDELVVRREISPNGKSRAFVNDTPVNLSQLNQLSNLLVDLHQQFDTLELGESDFQREVLDALAGTFPSVKAYRRLYDEAQATRKKLAVLQEQKAQFTKEFDYHQFQFTELDEAGFVPNELEDLDTELRLQTNAEGIKMALSKTYYNLEEGEEPILRQLKALSNGLQQYKDMHTDLPGLVQRLDSAYIELQDIADETDRINGHISSDPATIEKINERLSLGYKLLKKHGVKTTAELLEIRDSLNAKLQAVLNIDDEIAALEKEYQALLDKAVSAAAKISEARKKQVAPL
ncbi:MAG: recombination protein RecN, partial [Flaviaesturariibacter sp.]|nr:recombination protein RecN [Flaviaesturariibacter sp.]